jgi:hypothetical protein
MASLAGQKVGGFWDDTRNYIAKTRRLRLLPEKELQIITRSLECPGKPSLFRLRDHSNGFRRRLSSP